MMKPTRFAKMSQAEMERRHGLLERIAEEHQVDAIVAICNEDVLAGYVRWIAEEPIAGYRTAVMFVPREGATVIEHGDTDGERAHDPRSGDYPGVVAIHTVAAFQSAIYTAGYEAERLVDLVRKRGLKRIGLLAQANMPYGFFRMMSDGLEGVAKFADVTEAVDQQMAVKSFEELQHIRAAAALQDKVFEELLPDLRPGMREIDVTALVRAASLRLGGSAGVILAGSARQGEFAPFKPASHQNRVIEAGDYLSLLIENAGPSGHFTEIARNISFGRAGNALLEAGEQTRVLQEEILPHMRDGASCGDIFAEQNRQRVAMAHDRERRIFAHGQGYNVVERPLIRNDEPMPLRTGMNLAVHPTLADGENTFAVMCDNFVLEVDGMKRLHRTAQRVFEV
jgi:Xaa-Pro aminopeptidase